MQEPAGLWGLGVMVEMAEKERAEKERAEKERAEMAMEEKERAEMVATACTCHRS
jgi:hypothetical protein